MLAAIAWRPQIDAGDFAEADALAAFDRARVLLGVDIDIAFCPHAPGPPVCWCRKPIPGLVLELARRHGLALERSIIVGRSPSDRTLAERLGMEHRDHTDFFEPV